MGNHSWWCDWLEREVPGSGRSAVAQTLRDRDRKHNAGWQRLLTGWAVLSGHVPLNLNDSKPCPSLLPRPSQVEILSISNQLCEMPSEFAVTLPTTEPADDRANTTATKGDFFATGSSLGRQDLVNDRRGDQVPHRVTW